MSGSIEKRKHKRVKTKGYKILYSNENISARNCMLLNISKGGAFILSGSDPLPKIGERIACMISRLDGVAVLYGWAVVVRYENIEKENIKGFGIEFEKELNDDIIKELECQNEGEHE